MFEITMELLSDALPGSGEGLAGFVDSDIVFDEDGIPYVPGKRLKGILKESAEELRDADLINILPEDIFGTRGNKTGCDFKISNGYPENAASFRRVLTNKKSSNVAANKHFREIFCREQVLGYFTYTRAQTAVHEALESAAESSLRTLRVLKKGMKFVFRVEFPPEHLTALKDILKVTRFFGHNRTRGLGNIKLTLKGPFPETAQGLILSEIDDELNSRDRLFSIEVTLHNAGQLLLSSRVGENQATESYIPGSAILGALANHYIRAKGIDPESDNDFRQMFISGSIIFENAYPCRNGTVFYPIPLSFSTDKETVRIYDKSVPDISEKIRDENLRLKGIPGEYATLFGNRSRLIYGVRQISYHHRRPEDKGIGHALKDESGEVTGKDMGEFFQFEVLPSGLRFVSKIIGPYELLKDLTAILGKKMSFHLGKSKTAQFGLTEAEFGDIRNFALSINENKWETGEEMIIVLLSDMILLNENGLSSPDANLFVKDLEKELGVNTGGLRLRRKFLRYKNIGGYLGVWNLPRIQTSAIAAGSVMILSNEAGHELDLLQAINRSYGLRVEEGYGRITAYSESFESIEKENRDDKAFSDERGVMPDPGFINHILKNHIKTQLKKKILKRLPRKGISPSFLGRLQAIILGSNDFSEIGRQLSALKAQAKDKLKIVKEELFLKFQDAVDNRESRILCDSLGFSGIVEQAPGVSEVIDALFPEGESKISEFRQKYLFEFYREYASYWLSLLRFQLRNAREVSYEPNN